MNRAKDVTRLVRKARRSLGLNGNSQQELLRRARQALGLTNDELAQAIGVKPATLMAYLAPETAAKHRKLPADSRLILERILSEKKSAKRR
jgi:DNA-binding XRE family transcriptional regulator